MRFMGKPIAPLLFDDEKPEDVVLPTQCSRRTRRARSCLARRRCQLRGLSDGCGSAKEDLQVPHGWRRPIGDQGFAPIEFCRLRTPTNFMGAFVISADCDRRSGCAERTCAWWFWTRRRKRLAQRSRLPRRCRLKASGSSFSRLIAARVRLVLSTEQLHLESKIPL